MTLEEIKNAVNSGKKVFCQNGAYEVIIDKKGEFVLKKCSLDAYFIGLSWTDDATMNGKESNFFIK